MWWVALFGAIVLLGLVLYALLGLWLWRRARDLVREFDRAAIRAEAALGGADPGDGPSGVGSAETGGAHRG